MKLRYSVVFLFLMAGLIWLQFTIIKQDAEIHDLKIYISAGCVGRYQGAE